MRRTWLALVVGLAGGALCADPPDSFVDLGGGFPAGTVLRMRGPDGGVVWTSSEHPEDGPPPDFMPTGWWRGPGRYALTVGQPARCEGDAVVPATACAAIFDVELGEDGGCAVSTQVRACRTVEIVPVPVGDFPPYAPPMVQPSW